MSYRYYSTQRPLGPGAFPRPAGNRVEDITNYDRRTYIEELGREAWGSIDYEQPLTPEDARAYELTEAGLTRYTVQFLIIDLLNWDNTQEGYDRAVERSKTVLLHGVTDIDAVVEEYRSKYPEDRYDIDDIKWRAEQ